MNIDNKQIITETKNKLPKINLIEPSKSGYLLFALEVDSRPPIGFFLESQKKQKILAKLKSLTAKLQNESSVLAANVFKALIIPPGRGAFLKKRPQVEIAKFDVVLLLEFDNYESATKYQASKLWQESKASCQAEAKKVLSITGTNVKRIGAVDHLRQGVFLFNYFFADDVSQNLSVWEYTARWFVKHTKLDNSVLILPSTHSKNSYSLINHCRWDNLLDILPSLLFKPSFKKFILQTFAANNIAAMPILYRLA